jgi:hypothetical protein
LVSLRYWQTNNQPTNFQTDFSPCFQSDRDVHIDQPPLYFPALAQEVGPGKAFAQGSKPKIIIITPGTDLGMVYPNHITAIRQELKNSLFAKIDDYDDENLTLVQYDPRHQDDPSTHPPREGGRPQNCPYLNGTSHKL